MTARLTLPDQLIWVDEFDWSPTVRTLHRHPGGWYLERITDANNPRPITLVGGREGLISWAWITRANLLTLQTLLETAGPHRLTLHDARKFDCYAIGTPASATAPPPTPAHRPPTSSNRSASSAPPPDRWVCY